MIKDQTSTTTTLNRSALSMMTGSELIQKIQDLTMNAKHHQLETLHSILLHNSSSHYLQSFSNNNTPLDPSTFTTLVPLSSYEDYLDFIQQMADHHPTNHHPLLSVDPLLCFFYRYIIYLPF